MNTHTKPHVHKKLIKAWAQGDTIQVQYGNGTWKDIINPTWKAFSKYRIKPRTIEVRVNIDMTGFLSLVLPPNLRLTYDRDSNELLESEVIVLPVSTVQ
jgi:hypothetical protein